MAINAWNRFVIAFRAQLIVSRASAAAQSKIGSG
jgi:hypothetical protein